MIALRSIYRLLGLVALGLGAAGIVLPILPTTPFLLAAAWFFARSSPRMTTWLYQHPAIGPVLTDWQRHGAIALGPKCLALASMATGYAATISLVQPGALLAGGLALILLLVALFIVTRPLPTR
jgi:uncharacterized membrane protein YbaN (DUF454 family)